MSVGVVPIFPPESPTPQVEADMQDVFEAQCQMVLRLRGSTVIQREARFKRLREKLRSQRGSIFEAAWNLGKRPLEDVSFSDLMPVIMDISDYCRCLKKLLNPRGVAPL